MTSVASSDSKTKRETFFRIIFGDAQGYVCIGRRQPNTRMMREEFFRVPDEVQAMTHYIEGFANSYDLYFCPQVFGDKARKKEEVIATPTLWADLDTCEPDVLRVEPSIVLESSPRRYQALWILSEPCDPADAEDASRRIAYAHADEGADKSGWDLTQYLRVPFTYNHKYKTIPPPVVKILTTGRSDYTLKDFEVYEQVTGFEYVDVPFPEELPQVEAEQLLEEYRVHLKQQFWLLYNETPDKDWSKALWQVELFLAEAGMSREEMFIVAKEAACNKYRRDGRHESRLWIEVCKAFAKVEERSKYLPTGEYKTELPDLLTEGERQDCLVEKTFVERYVEWAKSVGDAAWQYHQAGAMIVLSSLLAGRVRLPTSFGVVVPNLWFMILADTTLTRKTTAMDMAVDILVEVDSDAVLATDGSLEGLMTSLSYRPGRPSLFLRDEFSGLLESMTKKDYYAGMAEALTKLYDGKYQKRILRKETIEVRDPCLIFFAGGIKTRVLELLTAEQVASGFMPRFCVVAAESDVASLRPLGPPSNESTATRDALVEELRKVGHHYITETLVTADGKTVSLPKRWNAELTPQAWHRYNKYEGQMLDAGLRAQAPDLATPTFDRLSKSGLKIAVLLAASRRMHSERILVEEDDIIRAFFYVEQWRPHTLEVLMTAGQSPGERNLQYVLKYIKANEGCTRSAVMQRFRLNAHNAEQMFLTLEQRGLIIRSKDGRTERLYPVDKDQ